MKKNEKKNEKKCKKNKKINPQIWKRKNRKIAEFLLNLISFLFN